MSQATGSETAHGLLLAIYAFVKLSKADQRVRVLRDLLDHDAFEIHLHGRAMILLAASSGLVDVMHVLLDDGRVDPSLEDNYAVWVAAENGRVEVLSLLLADARVDPSDVNHAAVKIAAARGHANVVRLLLSHPSVPVLAEALDCLWKERELRIEVLIAVVAARRGVSSCMRFDSYIRVDTPDIDSKEVTLASMLQQRRAGRCRGLELVEPYGRDILGYL